MNFNLDLNKFKTYYEENQKTVRMAALILIVGLSVLFFWIRGGSGNVEMNVSGNDPDIQEEGELDYGDEFELTDDEGEGAAASKPGVAYVDISGEVKLPGVYKVTSETRLFEVIDMAGGLTDEADANSLNRAERVTDGQKIIVRAYGEEQSETEGSGGSYPSDSEFDASGRVNINMADLSSLQTLPGIGPAKAQAIIDYREQNGYFTNIEEIMFVSGIGEKTFASIKDQIVV